MTPNKMAVIMLVVSIILSSFSIYMNFRAGRKLKLAIEFYDLAKQLYKQMQPQSEEHKEA